MKFSLRPKTFAERWRILMISLVAGAGLAATGFAAALTWIIWRGGWTVAVEAMRITALANALLAMIGLMAAAMVGMLVAGPLSKIKGGAGAISVEVEGDAE